MRKNKLTEEHMKAAHEIRELMNDGNKIGRDSMIESLSQMVKLTGNVKTPDAKAEMLKAHGVALGMAEYMRTDILPKYDSMPAELQALGNAKDAAEIMADIWFAKTLVAMFKRYQA